MLKIRAFFAWLIHYRLPYYYQKYISHTTITEKGEKLFLYCADIIAEKTRTKRLYRSDVGRTNPKNKNCTSMVT